MKIILTGGSGFLGKFVHQELLHRGYWDIFVPRSKLIDLTKFDKAQEMIRYYRPDTIIHLAAEVGGIGANMANPGRFFYANMSMGLNLIEASRLYHVNKFVQVGTVCSYPKICSVPFVEEDIWNGYPEETNAPYGVAKKALFVMLEAYHKQYNLKSCILVPSNLYGPGDNFKPESSHVIPALIKKFIDAKEGGLSFVDCWGDGSATREFLYVKDAAQAVVDGMEKINEPSPINLGGGSEVSIKDLATSIKDLVGYSGAIEWDESKPNGQPRRFLNISKAARLLGWKPKVSLIDGLAETVRWYAKSR
jgi:GDP-L-fucose synthase